MIMADKEAKTNLRLPEELYAKIRALAERERRSINQQMVVMLEEAVETRRKDDEEFQRTMAKYGPKE